MRRRTLGLFAGGLLVVALLLAMATEALAQTGPNDQTCAVWMLGGTGQGQWGPGGMMGGGMMGGWGRSRFGPGGMMGPGMMGGQGYGHGGMMGGWAQPSPAGSISLEQARQRVQACLDQLGNSDLAIDEVMEFQNNFYAIVKEKSTGTGAFELLVNKYTGWVFPEFGPNMMWNTKYGPMGQSSWMARMMGYQQPTGPMTISVDRAREIAQQWLDQYQPGSTPEDPYTFYGYYTIHTVKDGQVTGMLSVNGYSGQVWYHTWHGAFVAEE